MISVLALVLVLVALVLVAGAAWASVRFARLSPAAKRHLPARAVGQVPVALAGP